MRRDASTHARYCEAGFTLLEILVAMVVLAMIVTTAFGSLRLGERSWEAGHARTSETETLRTVAGVLQRQFNQILPLSWTEDAETTIAFNGSSERVRFIAPAPQHHGSTGLFEYTLVVEALDNSAHLVLYYRLHDPDSNGFEPEGSDRQRVLLVDELKSASFAFYGSPLADDAPQWHSQWSVEAESFPKLVQARLVTFAGQQPWPELNLVLQTQLAK
jgi:general secretion pathway protein J